MLNAKEQRNFCDIRGKVMLLWLSRRQDRNERIMLSAGC